MNTLSILEKLVAFDTTSRRSNLQCVEFIQKYLAGFNIACDLFFSDAKDKANIVAKIGDGPNPGIILSGHTDVVPVEGQQWKTDPFKLTLKNERAYGRGACDMKGFIASVISAVPKIINAKLSCPIYLVFSYDEEIGCVGVRRAIESFPGVKETVRACIVGEPTMMKPVSAHTGKQVVRLEFVGTAMHSSLAPKGVNAISYAGKVIAGLSKIEEDFKKDLIDDIRFEFPHPTVNIGRINGGEAINIVAEKCVFDVECRVPPGISIEKFRRSLEDLVEEEARAPMKRINAASTVTWQDLVDYPAFSVEVNASAAQLIRKVTGINHDCAVNYGTEAGLFQENGISTIVIGPGDIAQAHQPNEFINLSQLTACDIFMENLVHTISMEEQISARN